MQPVQITLTLSERGWIAESPELSGFVLIAETFMAAIAALPAALLAHCEHPVEFKVVHARLSDPTWPSQ